MSNYYYGIAMAVAMLIFYLFKEDDPNRILYLFAATWFVVHGVSEKVITALKPPVEKEKEIDSKS